MDNILKSDDGAKFLLGLPYQYLKNICGSNKLCISDEMDLVGLFEKYLKHRDTLPVLPEEDPSKDMTHLTEQEKEGRKKQAEDAKVEKAKKEEEEQK